MQSTNFVLKNALSKENKDVKSCKCEAQSQIEVSVGPIWDIALKKYPKAKGARKEKSITNHSSKTCFKGSCLQRK